MNKNTTAIRKCRHCGKNFISVANRVVFCSLLCRVESQTNKVAPRKCWPWLGAKDRDGYGRLRWNYKMIGAHIAMWSCCHSGPMPDHICVLHHCDNPSCVNPGHLFLGTVADNNADRDSKGRTGWNPKAGDNGRNSPRDDKGRFQCRAEVMCGV